MLVTLLADSPIGTLVILVVTFFLSIAIVELVFPKTLPRFLNGALSKIIEIYLKQRHPLKSIDSKTSIPSCTYVWPDGQGDEAKFLSGTENSAVWRRDYGGVYRIWAGTTPEIVLTRPDQLKIVFHDSHNHYKAINNDSGYLMGQMLGDCVGLISPPRWQRVREITEVPFHRNILSLHVQDIQRQVYDHFQELQKSSGMRQGLIHPTRDLKMLPFRAIREMIYGKLPDNLISQLDGLIGLRERLMGHVMKGGMSRYQLSSYLPIKPIQDLKAFKKQWKLFNENVFEYCSEKGVSPTFTEMYTTSLQNRISQDEFLQTLDEILFANLDVTMGGLSWNLAFLALDQDRQSKLRAEITTMDSEESQAQQYLQSSTTYLNACILESSRLRPLAAFSVPQSAPTVRQVDSFMIPARTNFVIDTHALNIESPCWAPDNTSFRPERFLEAKDTDLRYNFWRFGFGPRQCMGKYAADLLIRSTLYYLVKSYDLGLTHQDAVWTRDPNCWINHPDFVVRCNRR